ncbi:tRNA uridine(34) 5-carboxymethylaminomethyl modification radical SAM/GNAT enzyme Elp3 [Halorhabdus sp. CBA1104]|uniref:tRNA uridine(34) 5-carboxymethylaminomethyl modification radical SAM/GNAT enzyme Elp3 n=1 Tax=unclassified Halorhabdus TaxID=2621901 RepID=UPI0012B38AFD|nr:MULTISPECIES: tRNA uridine(34) 5-carboxymethylaminomethyl modification radical SAM/GNAT enzyme Elp3 [unclassified Halorhabdus]QGN06688.1 tRNA uridine(34) 5-carboxymethylaminomethyl modification radical SAM/GNAT enzyme Elp3 [Halorhabdus sp. CBA1104]
MSSDAVSERDPFEAACEELIERILDGDLDRDGLEAAKREVCSTYSAQKVPKNSALLDRAPDGRREELAAVVRRKPMRTASGVSPVAVMTSPENCPHGKCLYCPGGPDSEFESSQSYTGQEPAAARGVQNEYDPYGQVTLRLHQLRKIGHPIEKVELILMGGTMTARSHDYQEWFVKRALAAMNDYDVDCDPQPSETENFAQDPSEYDFQYLEDVIAENETGDVRNIATTFETKPDWCGPEQVDRMLRLGGTKVEVGVQTTFEAINREMHRGHGVDASIEANRRLRDAGFKVGFHMMPGQPGMSAEMVREDFRRLFERPEWRPDYLKIYPTLVVGGTVTYDMHRRGEFDPLTSEEAAELVADVKPTIPRYTRLQRVQRDIPAPLIESGVKKSNLRQLARQRMESRGESCSCIRCREVGHRDEEPEDVTLSVETYTVAGGTEHFISFEDRAHDLLVGFCRLRFPSEVVRRELEDAAVVRELHVYGSEVAIGDSGGEDWQHQGYGRRLIERAETLAVEAGYEKLAVLSGIGAREYYRDQLDYQQDGPYVSKRL